MEEGVRKIDKPWLLVGQTRTDRGWRDDLDRRWPSFSTRREAEEIRIAWNTPQLAQRGERYVVRRVK
jgi:hypothetical protein